MRISFAGTPDFAATALTALIEAGHDICLVLTQPDRPSGRGMKLKPSAVKSVALAHGIPVLTPKTLNVAKGGEEAELALRALENTQCDVLIVAAYGLILPVRALEAANGIGKEHDIRSINIHASLLPRWRGAAPAARGIEAGDRTSGITLMKMDAGLDTGNMIVQSEVPITEQDDAGTLIDKLAQTGATLIVKALEKASTLTHREQPKEGVTYAHKLLKTESPIQWNDSAQHIACRIRAFSPFPGATAKRQTETIKIWHAVPTDGEGSPGEILQIDEAIVIACGSGAIRCTQLQRAGKPIMDARSFAQSLQLKVGEVLS